MNYLLSQLVSAIVTMFASAFDTLGSASMSILSDFSIGKRSDSPTNAFDIVFPGTNVLYQAFVLIGVVILAAIFTVAMTRVFVSNGRIEEPVSIVFRTVIAGVLIFFIRTIIVSTEPLFERFMTYMFNAEVTLGDGKIFSWKELAYTINYAVETEDGVYALPQGEPLERLSNGLGTLIVVLILMLTVGYQYIMFLLEVISRYVILGVLIYSSPMAAGCLGSETTSGVFRNWLKMLISQFLLLILSGFIYRLFILGFHNFNNAIGDMSGMYPDVPTKSLVIMWTLFSAGILYVGTKLDSMMSSIGLSTAQVGAGLGTAIAAAGASAVAAVTAPVKLYKAASRAVSAAGGMASGNREHGKSSTGATYDSNGNASVDTMSSLGKGTLSSSGARDISGTRGGESMLRYSKGIPLGYNLDPSSFEASGNGKIRISTFESPDGSRTVITGTPFSQLDPSKTQRSKGRVLDVAGQKYFTQASGPNQADWYRDSTAENKMAALSRKPFTSAYRTEYLDNAGEVKSCEAWQIRSRASDGSDRTVHISSDNMYSPDPTMPGTAVRAGIYGEASYHEYSIPTTYEGEAIRTIPDESISAIAAGGDVGSAAFKNTFAAYSDSRITDVRVAREKGSESIISFKADGEQHVMAPSVDYTAPAGTHPSVHTASNGAYYADFKVSEAPEVINNSAEGADKYTGFFICREPESPFGIEKEDAPPRIIFGDTIQRSSYEKRTSTDQQRRDPFTPDPDNVIYQSDGSEHSQEHTKESSAVKDPFGHPENIFSTEENSSGSGAAEKEPATGSKYERKKETTYSSESSKEWKYDPSDIIDEEFFMHEEDFRDNE